MPNGTVPGDPVRDTAAGVALLSKDAYVSADFARREAERLWPFVWQVACRVEEIQRVGDYVSYEILNESIVVVRAAEDQIKAFHNVCMHRGRRLAGSCGHAKQLVCRFHGWAWNLHGENIRVIDRKDWADHLMDEDIRLRPVQVGTWGGFVFVNLDPSAEPLIKFLEPVDEYCSKFEFEKMRYRWYKTVIFPCNWKVALEAFNEAYHVQTTHRQFLDFLEEYSVSGGFGKHGAFWYPPLPEGQLRFRPSSRLNKPADPDTRKYLLAYYKEMHEELGAMVTPRTYQAVQRLLSEVPEDASGLEVLVKARQFAREAAEADGAGWPDLTPEYIARSMQDWHIFPNLVYLHSNIDGLIAYRSRPNGHDPNSCIFDIWSLVRYAPGKEPPLKREFYEDWKDLDCGRILLQDFANMADVQRGLRSSGFPGSRLNPVQEQAIINFHRVLRSFVGEQ